MTHAFLIDYEWCTGCHSCEVACQMFNGLPPEQFGIKLNSVGPWPYGDGKWQFDNVPVITDQCNRCSQRTDEGLSPLCVQHCQAQCLKYGELDALLETAGQKPKQILQIVA